MLAIAFFASPNQRAKYGAEVWVAVAAAIDAAGLTRKQAFEVFDVDGSGELSGEELVDGLRDSGVQLTDAYAEVIVADTDTDGSGDVDVAEWEAAIARALENVEADDAETARWAAVGV